MCDPFRNTFDMAPIGIAHVAPDGRYLRVNPWFCGMVGYSEEELLAKSFQEITHPEDLDRDLDLCQKTLRGELKYHRIEKRYVRKDGESICVNVTGSLVRSETEETDYIIVVAEEITDRKKAEQVLRRSEERLRLVIHNIPVMMSASDADGRIVAWNLECEGVTGYTAEEIVTDPDARKKLFPDDRMGNQVLRRGNKPDKGYHNLEREITCKDGTRKTISWSDISGRMMIPGWDSWSVGIDVTQRNRAEENLALLNDQLRKLTAYMHSAREKESTKIAQWIHDELGQELTNLKIDLVWLGKRLHGDQIALLEKTLSMEKNIDRTIEAVQRISRELRPDMLDDLGLVDSIEWFSLDFEKRTGILCNFVAESAEMDFGKEVSTTIFRILKEVMTNIFHHSGASESDVSLYNDSGHIMLDIKDNGYGISDHDATSPESFGLMQIRERAAYLNGTVRIEGIPDVGTVIKVSIPVPPHQGGANDSNPDH
jgi:PAS domain S-box-containing protein